MVVADAGGMRRAGSDCTGNIPSKPSRQRAGAPQEDFPELGSTVRAVRLRVDRRVVPLAVRPLRLAVPSRCDRPGSSLPVRRSVAVPAPQLGRIAENVVFLSERIRPAHIQEWGQEGNEAPNGPPPRSEVGLNSLLV
jgi:hypothetical protein